MVNHITVSYVSQVIDEKLDSAVKGFMTKQGFEIATENFSRLAMQRDLKFTRLARNGNELSNNASDAK